MRILHVYCTIVLSRIYTAVGGQISFCVPPLLGCTVVVHVLILPFVDGGRGATVLYVVLWGADTNVIV